MLAFLFSFFAYDHCFMNLISSPSFFDRTQTEGEAGADAVVAAVAAAAAAEVVLRSAVAGLTVAAAAAGDDDDAVAGESNWRNTNEAEAAADLKYCLL